MINKDAGCEVNDPQPQLCILEGLHPSDILENDRTRPVRWTVICSWFDSEHAGGLSLHQHVTYRFRIMAWFRAKLHELMYPNSVAIVLPARTARHYNG